MQNESPNHRMALEDFKIARRRAALKDVYGRLRGQPDSLLPFEEALNKLKGTGKQDRGIKTIPLSAIIGSVGRYTDFTRGFLPLKAYDADRWAAVKVKMLHGGGLPPIDVYQIGEAYFVLDGNHRVSVARQVGFKEIRAHVTEIITKVPLTAEDDLDDFIIKAEFADFLSQTKLDQSRPEADLRVTLPGQYRALYRQIIRCQSDFQCSIEEAATRWYDEVYTDVIKSIFEKGLLRDFPNRTETDLYAWMLRRREEIEKSLGREIDFWSMAVAFGEEENPKSSNLPNRIRKRLREILTPEPLEGGPRIGRWRSSITAARFPDHLITNMLVPVSGSEVSWLGLDQAIAMAKWEKDRIHGLHIVPNKEDRDSEAALAVKHAFEKRCQDAGIPAELVIDHGRISRKVCDHAVWADLVILNIHHPGGDDPVTRFTHGLYALIRSCSRPIIAVPKVKPVIQRLLLSYDGSLKAKEALFMAAYLAGKWNLSLDVLWVQEDQKSKKSPIKRAREYLDSRGVEANYLEEAGKPGDVILKLSGEHNIDMVIMGGYGLSPVLEMVYGSTVDTVLRDTQIPVMICR